MAVKIDDGFTMYYAETTSVGSRRELTCGYKAYMDGERHKCGAVLKGPKVYTGLRGGPRYKTRCTKCGVTNYIERND